MERKVLWQPAKKVKWFNEWGKPCSVTVPNPEVGPFWSLAEAEQASEEGAKPFALILPE